MEENNTFLNREITNLPQTSVVELQVPDIEQLPVGDELAGEMKLIPEVREQLDKQRACFESSEFVFVLAHMDGLGDAIGDIRQTVALATLKPEKQYLLYLPTALASINFNNLPPNISS